MQSIKAISGILKSLRMLDKKTVEMEFSDHVLIDSDGVYELYKRMDALTQIERMKKLLIIGEKTEITTDARQLIVQENDKRRKKIIAEAIVVNSFAQKLSANFYILFLRNTYPVKFFNKRDSALAWLKTFHK